MPSQLSWVTERLFGRPLMATPSYVGTVITILSDRLGVEPILAAEEMELKPRADREAMLHDDGVLVVPITGGLIHRGGSIDAASGAMSYTQLHNMMATGLADDSVKAILLDVDSPGGEVSGAFEAADMIAAASKVKPIWAIANGTMASAAYLLGASAARVFATKTSIVGSIGVITTHLDKSKMLEQKGMTATIIQGGAKKSLGTPLKALAEDDLAEIQADIDNLYTMFVDAIAERRSMSTEEIRSTEARTFLADKANELGLVDGVASFDKVRSMLATTANPKKSFRVLPGGRVLTATQGKGLSK